MVRAVCGLYPSALHDDLLSVGDLAILEGYVTHNAAKAAESTWVRKVIHWRLTEAVRGLPEEADATSQLDEAQTRDGHDTEREVLQNLALRVVGTLSPRHQAIVLGRLHDETLEEIAESLGISTARTGIEERNALKLLRKAMEKR